MPVPPEVGAMVAVVKGEVVGEGDGEAEAAGEIVGVISGEVIGVDDGEIVEVGVGELDGVISGETSDAGAGEEILIIIPVRAGMVPLPACEGIFCALSAAFSKIIAFSYSRIQTLFTFRGAESIRPRFCAVAKSGCQKVRKLYAKLFS